ncbi:MAG: hypothetical protein JSS43_07915 [Proteobacteria bacterium]|nr:hypothetical protein [Pseudomonadota bacterium]
MHQRFILFPILAAGLMASGAAKAMDSCTGTYSAALLSPLTAPTVVALAVSDNSDMTTRLAQAFTGGMQDAGVTVTGAPTVSLQLSYQVVGQGGSVPGGPVMSQAGDPQTGWSSWSGGQTAALQGGITLAMPDIPNTDMFNPAQGSQSGLLMLRAEARANGAGAPNWIAMLQCTVQTTDSLQLARQLGYLLGSAIGKEVRQSPV